MFESPIRHNFKDTSTSNSFWKSMNYLVHPTFILFENQDLEGTIQAQLSFALPGSTVAKHYLNNNSENYVYNFMIYSQILSTAWLPQR